MTEQPQKYELEPPEAQPEPEPRQTSPTPEPSMQLQLTRLIERHGWATVVQGLVEESDIFEDNRLARALERARDIAQDGENQKYQERLDPKLDPRILIKGILNANLSELLRKHQVPTLIYSLAEVLQEQNAEAWHRTIVNLECAVSSALESEAKGWEYE